VALFFACIAQMSAPATSFAKPIDSNGVEFSDPAPRIELRSALLPYHSASNFEADGSHWHIMTVANQLPRPVTRILLAEEVPDAALRLFPSRARPAIRQVVSSNPDVITEPAQAYGRHAFRVIVPASLTVTLALRLSDADAHPLVAAWSEGALSAHNRQLAVFFAAVAGLIAASLAITAGLAAMTGHPAPRWGAITLFVLFLSRLAASGVFDSIGAPNRGGPYGLSAMLAGLSLAAGLCLVDTIAPFENAWAAGPLWVGRILIGLVVLSLLSFFGVPGMMLATEIAAVIGMAAIVIYLVYRGRAGEQAARVAAPSAVVFALVAAAGAAIALGRLSDTPVAPGVIGGFAAAGAVLLALAISAGEGIAILPARRYAAGSHPVELAASRSNPAEQAGTFSDAIRASQQGVFDYDIDNGRIGLATDLVAMIGMRPAKTNLAVEEWLARIHPDDCAVFSSAIEDFRAHPGLAFRVEFRLASASERAPWFELRATMIGEGVRARRCLGLIADITSRKEGELKASSGGALASLPDKSAWMDELERLRPRLGASAVALVDIDRFKSIHASVGDDGGDAVLFEFAGRISSAFNIPQIYRVGGDCFAFHFPAAEDALDAFSSKLSEALSAPFSLGGRDIYVSASAGVAPGRSSSDPAELMKSAERALADAKRRGGGCACLIARDDLRSDDEDSVVLETELRQALRNGELEVFYQPIMRFNGETVAGFEALLRWKHPVRGLVEPSGFIDHSERTGSILELGRFALEQAAKELALWQRHFPLTPPLFVNVNLSRRQLQDDGFEPMLVGLLSQGNVAAGSLKLELTESAVAGSGDTAVRLQRLKSAGVGLAIDDFGTGVSSLSQLRGLPFDTLKIDKSFIANRHEGNGANGGSILRSIVRLAHELELSVVTEGVESAQDAQWLKDIGCEFGQGYHFSPPLSRGEVLAFIAKHHAGTDGNGAEPSGVPGMDGKAGDIDPQLA
jgi:diguanylate cyclase (GGDEF)-like protein